MLRFITYLCVFLCGLAIITDVQAGERKRKPARPHAASHRPAYHPPRRAPRPMRPSRPRPAWHSRRPVRPPRAASRPAPKPAAHRPAPFHPAPHVKAPPRGPVNQGQLGSAPRPLTGGGDQQNGRGPNDHPHFDRNPPPREQWGRGDWHRGLDVNVNVNLGGGGGWRPPALVVLTSPSYPIWYEPRPIVVNYSGPPVYYAGYSFTPGCSVRKSDGWDGFGWWHETRVDTCYANFPIEAITGTYRDPKGCVIKTTSGPIGDIWWRRQITRTCYFYAG